MPNSSGKETPVICSTSSKTFSSPRNLRRHEQNTHRMFAAPTPPTKCDDSRKSFSSMAEAREHVGLAHNVSTDSLCIYYHTIFLSVEKFRHHMSKNHQLPIWTPGNEVGTSTAPTESAFRGKVKTLRVERWGGWIGSDECNHAKQRVDWCVDRRKKEGPCKFQLDVDQKILEGNMNVTLCKLIFIWTKRISLNIKISEKTAAGYTHTFLLVGKFGRD